MLIRTVYRVAQKECNDFDPLFQRDSWLNTINFCCIGYNILLKVIFWHQVHHVCIRRFDSRAIFLRQCHFQKCYFFAESSLEAEEIFCLTASHGTSCVDNAKLLSSLWKGRQYEWNRGIYYATLWEAREGVGGGGRRCDFHCRGESRRGFVIIVMLSWKDAGWGTRPPTPGSEGPHSCSQISGKGGTFRATKSARELSKRGVFDFSPEISLKKWVVFLSLSLWTPEKFK